MIVAVLTASGCLQQDQWTTLSDGDVVGSWCARAGDFLTVSDDGAFLWTDISPNLYDPVMEKLYPPGNDPGRPTSTDPVSAAGQWELRELGGVRRLHLSVDEVDGEPTSFGFELIGSRIEGEIALLFYASDPDLGYDDRFTRCERPPPETP